MPDAPRLLLVDDEAQILNALRRTLRREGFEIITADSAAAALEICEKDAPAFVLSDQKMPGTTGIDLLEQIAARWPETGRALLTGWPEEVPEDRAQAAGLAAILPKPWDDATLKRLLHRELG